MVETRGERTTSETTTIRTVEWFKQPDQNLAMGGLLEQWLRHDDTNGYITKVPGKDYLARWVDYRGCKTHKDAQMREAYFSTLEEAQARIVEEVDKNPARFRNARPQEQI